MKQRTITTLIIIVVMTAVLFLSKFIVYPIVLALLSLGAIFELLKVLDYHKKYIASIPAYCIAAAAPIVAYFGKNMGYENFIVTAGTTMFVFLMYLFVVSIIECGKFRFSEISAVFVSVLYVSACFTSLCLLRYMENGLFNLGIVLVAAWLCDVGAYLVGSFMGKHKLIPAISPKKTVEGSIGGIVVAILSCLLYGYIVTWFTELVPNYLVLAICGFVLAIISQLGDLIASLIKREHGAKDYGNLLPGHGGIMDRFDSIIAASIALLFIVSKATPFT